jgi:hypothetical protein
MDQQERDNWKKVKVALEKNEKTDTYMYKRACVIAGGGDDPLKDVLSKG